MSGLFSSLNNGVKALSAQSQGVETAGRNLANVNNADYARQRVRFGDRGTVQTIQGPMSLGLEALGTEQIRDKLLDQQYCREIAIKASLTAGQAGLQKAQAGLGQSIASTSAVDSATQGTHGLAESMSEFLNAFTSLAAKPTDVGERQSLIQKTNILADKFQLTDSRLIQAQDDLTSQVKSDVESINELLQAIADINSQISHFEINSPGGAVDLRDSRQAKLEALATKMNFETRDIIGSHGQVQVYAKDSTGTAVILVDRGSKATLSTDAGATAITVTPITGPAVTLAVTSGSLRGSMDVRDNDIQDLRDSLDSLASQIVTSVNTIYSASGGNFLAGTSASTIRLAAGVTASNLAAGTGTSGDNSIALAISNLASHSFSTTGGDAIDGTFSQHFNQAVTGLGQALSGAISRLADQETITTLVKNQRDSISGVSLDEEMADLMKYQRAFQASSRVITMIDEMLDTIINRMG